jgi:hypothetical protein
MRKKICCQMAVLTIGFGFAMISPARASRHDILIVPARARMVQLAFDIQALRNVTIVSYRASDNPLQPLMHVWNRAGRNWLQIDVGQLQEERRLPAQPERVYVIGQTGAVPEVILLALSHAKTIQTIHSFSVSEILTAMDATLAFNRAEWQALAERYDLNLTEVNQEQNRWGRFGPPRRYREQPTPPQPVIPQPVPAPVMQPTAPTPTEPVAEQPVVDPQALFESIIAYEEAPVTIAPEPDVLPEPAKGIATDPVSLDPGTTEEDFPEK